MCWRPTAEELRLNSYVIETFGAKIIPDDMMLADFGVTYEELEPFLDRFEKIVGVSGKAGNIRGRNSRWRQSVRGASKFRVPAAAAAADTRRCSVFGGGA